MKTMKLLLMFMSFIGSFALHTNAQISDFGLYQNKLWMPTYFFDDGHGFINEKAHTFNAVPTFVFNKYYPGRVSFEGSISYIPYRQHYSTNKAWSVYSSGSSSWSLGLRACYSILRASFVDARIKGGIYLAISGMMKSEYYTYIEYNYNVIDSLTRGTARRDFTPIFPLLSGGLELDFKIAKRIKASIGTNYQKGIIRISELDIYYNNGSGNNDQHAKQWSTGDYYGWQLGIKYLLGDENGNKFRIKKNN